MSKEQGRWDILYPLQIGEIKIGIEHAALLRTGKVIFLSDEPYTLIWDPLNENNRDFQLLPNSETGLTTSVVCSGHSFLSNGHLLAVGGGGLDSVDAKLKAWIFDPINLKWRETKEPMHNRRWYPTCVTLPDKRVLVAGGLSEDIAKNMEIYDESTDVFTNVTTSGKVGEKLFPQTYPGLNLLPGGEIFYTPVGFGDCGQIARPFQETEDSGYFKFNGPNSGEWTNTGANIRTKGIQVILLQNSKPFVRIMVIGGGDIIQSKTAQLIDLSTLPSKWEPSFPILESRIHPNAVLLPDSTIFICGGMTNQGLSSSGGRCELYNPIDNTISEMAPLNYPRHYHSIALLLPNGKVLAAGGAEDSGCGESLNNPIEVFSPPYLFKGPRPVITQINPSRIHIGSTFEIETPQDNISKVVIVRPMAETHQTDTEQRVIPLSFKNTSNTILSVTAPDEKPPIGVIPKGFYMLFILNDKGVPSIAKFVLLQ
jgi:Galactose oxidase-like, Early set domain/Glyoxal oxidase N-terminus/Kelch motif